ncbi:MAG: Translation initiation factor [Pseudomonadota bacterium]|jgi:hypothetical protein
MAKEEAIEMEGVVIENLPNTHFRVKLDNEHIVLAHFWAHAKKLYSYTDGRSSNGSTHALRSNQRSHYL